MLQKGFSQLFFAWSDEFHWNYETTTQEIGLIISLAYLGWKGAGRNSVLLKMGIALKFTETYNKNWLFVYSLRIITFNLKLNFLAYSCLIPWQIQKTTYSTCEQHTLTLLSSYIVFSCLLWLSSVVSQLCMCSLFELGIIKNF